MNTISKRKHVILSEVHKDVVERSSALLLCFLALFLTACDFHGPWDYYPEEREVYTGIYTYGYILADGEANVCFSKVYELDEASSQDFSFYDDAEVTISGVFRDGDRKTVDTTLRLYNYKPNCFNNRYYYGIIGESYTLEASFKWDSAGHTVNSSYKAVATIPNKIKIKGLNAPQQDGSYKWIENPWNDTTRKFYPDVDFNISFLEFPMDMEFVKVALDYDQSVRGVLSIMNYGIGNGESQNTTMANMFDGMTETDEAGYRGVSMHDPLEEQQNLGFSSNRNVAGNKSLDTLYLMNMMLPLGKFSVDLYSTDDAYIDYMEKVKQSVMDSRFVPESNIQNGMGVFSGMAKTTVTIYVRGDGIGFSHIGWRNCADTKGDNNDSWDSRGCRLYQDIACSGMSDDEVESYGLIEANEYSTHIYRDSVYNRNVKACYASNVKAAMMLDTTKWSQFLPDTISAENKAKAYADGLKRYCVANNFESNKIADCSTLKQDCLEDMESNYCKEYLWLWCADRGWNMDYEQCKSAFVSRYYLQNLKSSVLKREVESICRHSLVDIAACGNWCKVVDGKTECQ